MEIHIEDLRHALDETAHEFTQEAPDVHIWDDLLVDFLEGMEWQAACLDREHPHDYEGLLLRLKGRIEARLKEGSW
jgi:hypothetical protein